MPVFSFWECTVIIKNEHKSLCVKGIFSHIASKSKGVLASDRVEPRAELGSWDSCSPPLHVFLSLYMCIFLSLYMCIFLSIPIFVVIVLFPSVFVLATSFYELA